MKRIDKIIWLAALYAASLPLSPTATANDDLNVCSGLIDVPREFIVCADCAPYDPPTQSVGKPSMLSFAMPTPVAGELVKVTLETELSELSDRTVQRTEYAAARMKSIKVVFSKPGRTVHASVPDHILTIISYPDLKGVDYTMRRKPDSPADKFELRITIPHGSPEYLDACARILCGDDPDASRSKAEISQHMKIWIAPDGKVTRQNQIPKACRDLAVD